MAESKDFSAEAGSAKVVGTVSSGDIAEPVAPPMGLRAIGPRITFHFAGEWNAETSYVLYDVVRVNGTSYIANKINIAKGVDPETDNNAHWVKWNDPNAQVELLQQTVNNFDGRITAVETEASDASATAAEAKKASADNTAAIEAEATRAKAAEAANETAIEAEATRAKAAEEAISSSIEADGSDKWFAYIFQDTQLRQSTEYFTDFITRCKKAGFAALQMTIHVNEDGSIIENESKFAEYNAIAEQIGISIVSVKMHGVYTYPNYFDHIKTALAAFPKVSTVFILNEDLTNAAQGVPIMNQIKQINPKIRVGITGSYTDCFEGKRNYTGIDNYDILGVNMYPICAQYNNPVVDETVIHDAFNRRMIVPWDKELWITECGVLPYLQYLNNPEQYTHEKLTDTNKTIEGQKAFYKELSKCNTASRATHIIPWYMESFMDASLNYQMFNEFKSIIKGW